MYLNKMSPALDTPPPMTKIWGSTTLATAASPLPRYSPNCSAISIATLSPALTASNTVLAEISPPRRMLGASSFARRLFASRVIPVADAYCSRQPLFLQPQVSVSASSIWICPISPPAPLVPVRILPSMMMPPPMPVPSVTAMAYFAPCAAPAMYSP